MATGNAGDLAEIQERTFAKATKATAENYPPERRLTGEQLEAYLDRRQYAVVGTTRKDGRPHSSLSLYYRLGTSFWLPTVSGTVRARNLARQPWLTLVVAEGDGHEHVVAMIEGPARVLSLGETPEEVRVMTSQEWVNAWIRLDAERLLSYADEEVSLSPAD